MKSRFGEFVRKRREELKEKDKKFSLRQVASRIGVQPSFLSKIERGDEVAVSEEKIQALASELDIEPDVLLALNGKVSKDIQEIIMKRPQLFAKLLREMKGLPDHAILRIVRQVRDGEW
jgi:transcriptional regulator with XRE-family HTH domain